MLKRIDGKLHTRVDIALKHNAQDGLAHVYIDKDMDNGTLVTLGALMDGELMAKKAEAVTGTSKRDELVLLKAPEIVADESSKYNAALKNFYNTKGEIVRGYYLKDLDLIHISEEGIDASGVSALAVGQYVVPDASGKFKASDSNTNAIGKIIAKNTEGIKTYYDATAKNFIGNSYDMYYIELI